MIRRKSPQRKRRAPASPLTLETKWGWQPCIEQGMCAVPASFLRSAAALGITAEEGWLLIQLLDLKWQEGRSTMEALTERCLFGEDTIQSLLLSLQERKFLKLIPKYPISRELFSEDGRGHNPAAKAPVGWEIDLSPLLQALNEYIMRGGDLTAGFLHLSTIRIEKERSPAKEG